MISPSEKIGVPLAHSTAVPLFKITTGPEDPMSSTELEKIEPDSEPLIFKLAELDDLKTSLFSSNLNDAS